MTKTPVTAVECDVIQEWARGIAVPPPCLKPLGDRTCSRAFAPGPNPFAYRIAARGADFACVRRHTLPVHDLAVAWRAQMNWFPEFRWNTWVEARPSAASNNGVVHLLAFGKMYFAAVVEAGLAAEECCSADIALYSAPAAVAIEAHSCHALQIRCRALMLIPAVGREQPRASTHALSISAFLVIGRHRYR